MKTPKETFEAYVREKCPELMKLSFGCEVKYEDSETGKTYTALESGHNMKGTPFYFVDLLGVEKSPNRMVLEIIGHPIQLHHVLKVLETTHMATYSLLVTGELMELVEVFDDETSQWNPTGIHLPLTPPSEWPEETFEQLNEILGL